jgi:hypothetical protein
MQQMMQGGRVLNLVVLVRGTLRATQLELSTLTVHAGVLEVDGLPKALMRVFVNSDILI